MAIFNKRIRLHDTFSRVVYRKLTSACPLDCGQELPLLDIQEHVRNACQNRTTWCPAKSCLFTSMAKDMDAHLNTCPLITVVCTRCLLPVPRARLNEHKCLLRAMCAVRNMAEQLRIAAAAYGVMAVKEPCDDLQPPGTSTEAVSVFADGSCSKTGDRLWTAELCDYLQDRQLEEFLKWCPMSITSGSGETLRIRTAQDYSGALWPPPDHVYLPGNESLPIHFWKKEWREEFPELNKAGPMRPVLQRQFGVEAEASSSTARQTATEQRYQSTSVPLGIRRGFSNRINLRLPFRLEPQRTSTPLATEIESSTSSNSSGPLAFDGPTSDSEDTGFTIPRGSNPFIAHDYRQGAKRANVLAKLSDAPGPYTIWKPTRIRGPPGYMFELRAEPLTGPAILNFDGQPGFGAHEAERNYIMASVRVADMSSSGQPLYDWVHSGPGTESASNPLALENVQNLYPVLPPANTARAEIESDDEVLMDAIAAATESQ
jgi:hypothetical protein